MMTFTQYLLSKIAEETVELTKEILKGQQQGLFSVHRGKTNHSFIGDEFLDVIARAELIKVCADLPADMDLFPVKIQADPINVDKMELSKAKMCYYALYAYDSGFLRLTQIEEAIVRDYASKFTPPTITTF